MIPDNVKKYLAKYSPGNWKVEHPGINLFKNIVVIPAIHEYNNIQNLLNSLSDCSPEYFKDSLFLFVINNTSSAPADAVDNNARTLIYLRELIHSSKEKLNGLNIGVVDASSSNLALPEKDGGVGLARKIGMDLSLSLFDYSRKGKNILICLDADCTVERNYLTGIVENYNHRNLNAAYVPFEHPMPVEIENRLAIINYEIFLRYYVLGLIYANSGYAIHTIGSTMICDHESYIKVEGMNKKKAAEDFYFMEKLCKNYPVNMIEGTCVYPSSRGSWRVPFGTGQRVNRYLSKTQNEYLLYSPLSFEILKKWLEVFNSPLKLNAIEYLLAARKIHPSLEKFLIENKFEESWNRIEENCSNDMQLKKQKHFWFDGFRTLKLIHYLRDNGFPLVEMYSAVDTLLNKFGRNTGLEFSSDIHINPDNQMQYLKILREIA